MADLFTSIELWVGLGLILGMVVLFGGKGNSKRTAARLNRVAGRKTQVAAMTQAQSLRRLDPNQNSAFGQLLGSMRSISKLKARLETAGVEASPQKFVGIMAGIALFVFFVVGIMLGKSLLIALLLGILCGLALPHMYVGRKIKKRTKRFLLLFPEAIDLMVRGLRAGLPVAESFITVSHEVPPPLGDVFARISQQTGLGVPMEKALADTAEKLDITEFNFFVTSIILQRETGGNLGEILSNLSDMLRQRHMMKLKIGALSSEARASAYIVGSLPFFVFGMLMVLSPAYLRPLFDDFRGNLSLAAAAGMMGFGALVMGKMTQLEI